MAEFNRGAFKATTMESLDSEKKRAEAAVPQNSYSGRAGFLEIKDGKNYRRIAPAHKQGDPAYRAMTTTWLECEVDEYKDNEKTGKKEVKKKKVFIATQHSAKMKNCPVLMYIEYVHKRAEDEFTDKDSRQKFLAPINGYRGADKKWVWGIDPMTSFICYAWDEAGKLGREELRPKWMEEMRRLSVDANEDNDSIVCDIFTDPDEGYPLIIDKTKDDKNKDVYIISKDIPNEKKRESWADFFQRVMVTDNQLIELSSKESLTELYYDVYTTRDFNFAIDGLRRFDTKFKYGIFENEEFIERLEIMKETVPEYSESETDQKSAPPQESESVKETPKKEVKAEESAVVNPPLSVPIPKMKTIIKEYILENYGADYSMPELTIPQVKEWYQLCKQGGELPFDEEGETTTTNTVTEEPLKKVEEPVVSESIITSTDDSTTDAIKKMREARAKARAEKGN